MAWQRMARVTGVLLVFASAGTLGAQNMSNTQRPLRPGQTRGPSFMVPVVIRSADRVLGQQVADAIRDRLMSDNLMTTIYVMPKKDVVTNLEQSGYSATDALSDNDLRQLAAFIRADEYVTGVVTKAPDGTLSLKPMLLLPRGDGMEQPLPEVTGNKPGDLAGKVSREIGDARKQIEYANNCMQANRQRNYAEAKEQAAKGIAEYADAVMPRMCLIEVALAQKAGPDTLIRIAEEVLKVHPTNDRALKVVVDQYATKSATDKAYFDKYIGALEQLLKADPSNTTLQRQIAEALASANQMDKAKAVIDSAVKRNPGDPDLVRLQWRIYRSLGDWKEVTRIGEEMARQDTSVADTLFFQQLVAAYLSDSQPQKAQEVASRGAAKFSRNATLWLTVAQLARQNGQLPQALDAINRLLSINPQAQGAYMQKAAIFNEQGNLDSLIVAVRASAAAGDDKTVGGTMLLQKGNELLKAYQADSVKTVEGGEHVLSVLAIADSINPTPTSGFLMGATQVLLGQALYTRASETKSCDDARRMNDMLISAQDLVRKNGREFGAAAGSVMQGAITLQEYANKAVQAFCKG